MNAATLVGYLPGKLKFDHESNGKRIYSGTIMLFHGKNEDKIPFRTETVPEEIEFDTMYEVTGEIRSRAVDHQGTVEQYLWVTHIGTSELENYRNEVSISGQVKRPPRTRITKTNGAKITSFCINVGRENRCGAYDSVMCTAFKGNAEKAEELMTGEVVKVNGKLAVYTAQSNGAKCMEVHVTDIERGEG